MKSFIRLTAILAVFAALAFGCASTSGKYLAAPIGAGGLDFNGPVDYNRSNPETHPQSDKIIGEEEKPDVIVVKPTEETTEPGRIIIDVEPVKRPVGPYTFSVWFGSGADTEADPFAQRENLIGPGASFEYELIELEPLIKFSVNAGAALFFLEFKDYGGTVVNGNTNLYDKTATRIVPGVDLFAEAMIPLDQFFETDFVLYGGLRQTFTGDGNHVHPIDGRGYTYGFGYYLTNNIMFRGTVSTEREHYMLGLGFQF